MNRPVYNLLNLLAIIAAVGCVLWGPTNTHLHCRKDVCYYRTSAMIGGTKESYRFPLSAISDVSIKQRYHRRRAFHHIDYSVSITEAEHQLEVKTFEQQQDAEALANRIRFFMNTPTEAPLDTSYNELIDAVSQIFWPTLPIWIVVCVSFVLYRFYCLRQGGG